MAITKVTRNLLSTGIDDQSNATAITIDSSENVGIGESSPAEALTVVGTIRVQSASGDTDGLHISSDSGGDALINAGYSVSDLKFATNDTERMRIDSSGNLLVGVTSNAPTTTAGINLGANNKLHATRSGGTSGYFNRLSSDGGIVEFAKDGTTVGSIGATGSNVVIGTGSVGLRFYDGGNAVIPHTAAGGSSNGLVDLGQGGFNEFKDLYLSGNINGISAAKSASGNRWGILPEVESNGVMEIGRYLDFHATDGDTSDYTARLDANGSQLVSTAAMNLQGGLYLGGSGSANHLDDYEEGTFTATLENTGTSPAPTANGSYTKIGRQVTIHIYFAASSSITSAGNCRISGLPFSASAINNSYGMVFYTHGNVVADNKGSGYISGTNIDIIAEGSTGYAQWNTGSKYGMWTGIYQTA